MFPWCFVLFLIFFHSSRTASVREEASNWPNEENLAEEGKQTNSSVYWQLTEKSSWLVPIFPIAVQGSSRTSSTSQPTTAATVPQIHATRKPDQGPPKGSSSRIEERPRRLGRPPGTGYRQRARALVNTDAPQKAKRPVGRPRKRQAGPAVSVNFQPGPLVCFHFILLLTLWLIDRKSVV